jgi:hypothetical protein
VQEPLARRMLPRVDRRDIAAIFTGGALGTMARAALAEAFPHPATPGRIARGYSVIDELTRERGPGDLRDHQLPRRDRP